MTTEEPEATVAGDREKEAKSKSESGLDGYESRCTLGSIFFVGREMTAMRGRGEHFALLTEARLTQRRGGQLNVLTGGNKVRRCGTRKGVMVYVAARQDRLEM